MSKLFYPRNLAKTGITLQASGSHVDLYLFGVIGDWWDGNTAQAVLNQLRDADGVTTITVKLSTVGGYFEDGLPIYNLLKQHKAAVTVEVIGYALSMGSVIMLAGNTIRIAQNALVMMHNAQGLSHGSPSDLRKAAAILETHEAAIIPRYMERMGKTASEVKALLDEETWFTADQALASGLVDEIIDPVDLASVDKNQPSNAWEFAAKTFRYPPAAFVERVDDAATPTAGWLQKILNRMVGELPPAIPPNPEYTEVDMTSDELKATIAKAATDAAAAVVEKIDALVTDKLAALKAEPPAQEPPLEQNPDAAALVTLRTELAAANAELAELKKVTPNNAMQPGIVSAPAGIATAYDDELEDI